MIFAEFNNKKFWLNCNNGKIKSTQLSWNEKKYINNPFCGTIVPLKFYRKNKNVYSVMLEINRSLYMNEVTGKKNKNFMRVKRNLEQVISLCPYLT